MKEKNLPSESITFLGTGGSRFVMISQVLATGGLWLNLDGTEILIDPGPGCIIQSTRRKLRAERLSAIILSHRHLDHSADVNIMVEAMTQGGFRQYGRFFAPSDALNSEPVIFSYLKNRLDSIEVLQEGKSYSLGKISFTTPVRHIHMVETYGMVFKTPGHSFSYITDTRYFDGLCQHYGSELLIISVVFPEPKLPTDFFALPNGAELPFDHLSMADAERIIRELKPKAAILTHFGMSVWRAQPWLIAERLSQRTGVRVLAARDGWRFDLAELDS